MKIPSRFEHANYPFRAPKSNFASLRERIYKKYPELNTSQTWFINVYNGLGDALPILGYISEFRAFHNARYVIVIAREGLQPLVRAYRSAFELDVALPADLIEPEAFSNSFAPNSLIYTSKAHVYGGHWVNFAVANNVPIFDWYKLGLRIPMASKFAPPNWNYLLESDLSIEESRIVDSKSMILCPFTSFGSRLPSEFWEAVARVGVEHGYKMFTNIGQASNVGALREPSLTAMKNTLALEWPLERVLALCVNGVRVVTGSGGLAFVAATTKAPVFVFYNNERILGSDLNSSQPGVQITPIESFEGVGRSLGTRDYNLREAIANPKGLAEFQVWCSAGQAH